ncbi:CHAD domain-containing protein [Paraburkholderia dipogonis]|uniref:CHAD domain-containing protein n=1 Tax=Paraburkholderia dipogonis TaxID=1211383 RepID=UPI0038BB4E69
MLDERFDNEQRALFKSLADAGGKTRDWDILIGLVERDSDASLLDSLKTNRNETAEASAETLRHSHLDKSLHATVSEAHRELEAAPERTPLRKFGRKRVTAAQNQLKKGVCTTRAKQAALTTVLTTVCVKG